ncbi:MAG: type I restriction endonuclease [Chloroflexota bacterium]
MEKDQIRQVIHTTLTAVKQFLAQEAPPKLSEADTKANFIEPILGPLGWVGIGIVIREYYVKNSQEFIDYVMSDNGRPLLAIEAKALQADLSEKAAAQLVQYCVVEGIEWAVLTNGRELRFFNTYLKGDLAAKLVLRLDLLAFNSDIEYDALFDQIWLLSRESMTTPSGVSTWLEQRRMDQALRALLLNSASPVVRILRKHLSESDVKATPEAISQWFRAQLSTNITPLPIQGVRPKSSPPALQEAPPSKPRIIQLASTDCAYYMLVCSKWSGGSAVEHLRLWLDHGMWGMNASTPGRERLRPGDRACFYVTGSGIAATATITAAADVMIPPEDVPAGSRIEPVYRVPLANIEWFASPIALDAPLRLSMDAFADRPAGRFWGWFTITTRGVTARDFALMTGQSRARSG